MPLQVAASAINSAPGANALNSGDISPKMLRKPIDFSLESNPLIPSRSSSPLLEHLDVVLGLVHVGVAHGVGEAREVVGELAAVVHLEGRALPRRVHHADAALDLFRPSNATSTFENGRICRNIEIFQDPKLF